MKIVPLNWFCIFSILPGKGFSCIMENMVKEGSSKRKRLPVSVSAAVFIKDEEGKLLLVQQEAGWKKQKWGPPAGGMHAFETPIETALREAQEEIGVEVELVDLIGVYTAKRGEKRTGIGFNFRGRIKKGEMKLKDGEIKNAQFFSPREIRKLISEGQLYKPEYNLQGIEDWLAGKSFSLEIIK